MTYRFRLQEVVSIVLGFNIVISYEIVVVSILGDVKLELRMEFITVSDRIRCRFFNVSELYNSNNCIRCEVKLIQQLASHLLISTSINSALVKFNCNTDSL